MADHTLLSTQEAADRLGLSRRTVEDWRVKGCGPSYRKHGGRVFYTRHDLDAWSEGTRRTSTSEQQSAA